MDTPEQHTYDHIIQSTETIKEERRRRKLIEVKRFVPK